MHLPAARVASNHVATENEQFDGARWHGGLNRLALLREWCAPPGHGQKLPGYLRACGRLESLLASTETRLGARPRITRLLAQPASGAVAGAGGWRQICRRRPQNLPSSSDVLSGLSRYDASQLHSYGCNRKGRVPVYEPSLDPYGA